jgi:hypothetical protein
MNTNETSTELGKSEIHLSKGERLANFPPTGDLDGWFYEYDWRYELKGRKATVYEAQSVFAAWSQTRVGVREYQIFIGTELQAITVIKRKVEEFRKVGSQTILGCQAANESRWKWIETTLAVKLLNAGLYRQKS